LKDYKAELEDDVIVRAHLDSLCDTMLEQNICRIIEPYLRVQVFSIASTIKLPIQKTETRDEKLKKIASGLQNLRTRRKNCKKFENLLEIAFK
jgi:hypothetical protein